MSAIASKRETTKGDETENRQTAFLPALYRQETGKQA